MKKIIVMIMCVVMICMSFVACTGNERKEDSSSSNAVSNFENTSSVDINNNIETTAGNSKHEEYVTTYYVYAEEGAVVTWYDPQTGDFSYKDKCEFCGEISSGEHSGGLRVAGNSEYSANFTCGNSNCAMWGESQRAIIGCNENGEWVEVAD